MENEERIHDDHHKWTEAVEDLVHEGEVDKAITLLQTIISNLEQQHQHKNNNNNLQLSTALLDLSKLYTIKGFSLKADEASHRALLIKHQSHLPKGDSNIGKELARDEVSAGGGKTEDGIRGDSSDLQIGGSTCDGASEDDWEAIADCAPEELLPPQSLPEISKLSIEEPKVQSSKRRGRGTFAYKKHGLYSDQQCDVPIFDDSQDNSERNISEDDFHIGKSKYGTRHILVLADFPPSTKTTDLEKLLEDFKDHGIVIRWVNDTVALAVFRSPSHALEASKGIQFPFTVRILDEDDELLSLIPPRDLEPPRPRPKTSARTAQRLIAQSMGIKLPSSSFGSRELRKQEEERRNRIVARQHLRDNAWGDDD